MQPADLTVALRRRSPWEATDLGLAMLQRWWRPVYAAHALVVAPIALALVALGWAYDAVWAGILAFWWLEPLYDRVVLHVLSRAVFGEMSRPLSVLRSWRDWKGGLFAALALRVIVWDLARSFNLPVRQLERSRGREARERQRLLGRRARSGGVAHDGLAALRGGAAHVGERDGGAPAAGGPRARSGRRGPVPLRLRRSDEDGDGLRRADLRRGH